MPLRGIRHDLLSNYGRRGELFPPSSALFCGPGQELRLQRIRHRDGVALRRELTGGRVHAEDDGVVAGLVGDDDPATGRVEGETARGLAAGGNMLHEAQAAGLFVDRENHEAVVAAVGRVEEFAVGVD